MSYSRQRPFGQNLMVLFLERIIMRQGLLNGFYSHFLGQTRHRTWTPFKPDDHSKSTFDCCCFASASAWLLVLLGTAWESSREYRARQTRSTRGNSIIVSACKKKPSGRRSMPWMGLSLLHICTAHVSLKTLSTSSSSSAVVAAAAQEE